MVIVQSWQFKLIFLWSFIFFVESIYARSEKSKIEQLQIGNLALPASQQPGPLIGFGQNMLDKGDLQFFCYLENLIGCNKNFTTIMPALLYGIKDNFSMLIELPIAANFEINDQSFQGLQDLLVQFEYAVYDQMSVDRTNQITLVANLTLPTGLKSGAHQQNFGSASFSAPTFFLGTTLSHMDTTWYPCVSAGFQCTTKNEGTKIGNQCLYQCGLSRNIRSEKDKYIFNVTVEFDGMYKEKNKTNGIDDQNSGGNQILLGPSCWFSTQSLIFQAGISWVIYQALNGVQNKNNYYFAIDLGYKF